LIIQNPKPPRALTKPARGSAGPFFPEKTSRLEEKERAEEQISLGRGDRCSARWQQS
jgi:hypothetical protein